VMRLMEHRGATLRRLRETEFAGASKGEGADVSVKWATGMSSIEVAGVSSIGRFGVSKVVSIGVAGMSSLGSAGVTSVVGKEMTFSWASVKTTDGRDVFVWIE
jgi:hypothetical protein